jgi:hypothetical protein
MKIIRPSDFFSGFIYVQNTKLFPVEGSYLGWVNIGNKRYWEVMKYTPIKVKFDFFIIEK